MHAQTSLLTFGNIASIKALMDILRRMKLKITPREVLRLQGYKKDGNPEAEVARILDQAIQEGYQLIEPKVIYDEISVVGVKDDRIKLEGGLTLGNKNILKSWRNLELLGIALCTIDLALENRVSELFAKGDYALALMLDSVGSAAVESLADSANYYICHKAKNLGFKVGSRLSPGYGKWGLKEQRTIFSLVPGDKIGVRLTKRYMMIPRKSVSFCVGIGRELIDEQGNPCRYCELEGCPYREERQR